MHNLIRVLVIGFAAVIALLAAAALMGVNNIRSIGASAAQVSDQLAVIAQLTDELEREQAVLNAAFYRLSRTPGVVDRQRVLADLGQTDDEIARMAAQPRDPDTTEAWNSLQRAAVDFSKEARRLLTRSREPGDSSTDLFSRYEEVTRAVARLGDLSYTRALQSREGMEEQSTRFVEESAVLLGGSILVALICAVVTVRIAMRVFRQMESQAGELSRVSFRMLETQESTARRFSHELHDELGGSLTAIKSNLSAIAANPSNRGRIEDCMKLVDESISNVRELSQLLRPTILDDFGLDAGIGWLVNRFRERTGIETEYRSDFDGRLPDETETHLFRIVQEALTNVARHSGATHVSIDLHARDNRIRLTIHDDGKGIGTPRAGGMGLNGMRARARSAGGELELRSQPGGGLTIEVTAPLAKPARVNQVPQESL